MTGSAHNPRQEQDVSDNQIGLDYAESGDMRDGKPLEYDWKRFQEARSEPPKTFADIVRQGELAKAIIITDEIIKSFDKAYPEILFIERINNYLEKFDKDDDLDDINKTNLPSSPVEEEESVASLSPEERKKGKK